MIVDVRAPRRRSELENASILTPATRQEGTGPPQGQSKPPCLASSQAPSLPHGIDAGGDHRATCPSAPRREGWELEVPSQTGRAHPEGRDLNGAAAAGFSPDSYASLRPCKPPSHDQAGPTGAGKRPPRPPPPHSTPLSAVPSHAARAREPAPSWPGPPAPLPLGTQPIGQNAGSPRP
jgi:hypothetical protein